MHHVQNYNSVLEVRRGLVVSTVLFPPISLKYRVIKALELCFCGKEKKKYGISAKFIFKNATVYFIFLSRL